MWAGENKNSTTKYKKQLESWHAGRPESLKSRVILIPQAFQPPGAFRVFVVNKYFP
jgi:hypothetical protein